MRQETNLTEEIRDSLIARGFKASSPKNLLINVHTVISRLHDARELDTAQKDGKPAYMRRKTIGQMIAEGGESWTGPGSAERSGMLGSGTSKK